MSVMRGKSHAYFSAALAPGRAEASVLSDELQGAPRLVSTGGPSVCEWVGATTPSGQVTGHGKG